MNVLGGKVALITGAARGIGAATARAFSAAGAALLLTDIMYEPAAAASLPNATYHHLDVSDEAGWADAVSAALARFGRLDILVNNAGIFKTASLADTSVEMFMQTVRINQLGVFLGMRAVADAMAASGGGSIINLSSVAGLIGSPKTVAYTGSKWAVRGMTKTAAIELAPHKIRVNSIHPGWVDTPMLDGPLTAAQKIAAATHSPLQRMAAAEDIAAMALFLASDASAYSTGSEFICDGGITMA
jgi:3alpha(or 20beta)-hydroxysteroid dehydrogenase